MREASLIEEREAGSDVSQGQIAEPAEPSTGPIAANAVEMAATEEPPGEDTAGEVATDPPLMQDEDSGAPAADGSSGQPSEAPTQDGAAELAAATGASDSGSRAEENPDQEVHESFAAHLSSVRSRNGTETEWQTLRDLYPSLLGGKTLTVRTVEVAEKGTFYRVMAGRFDTYDEAEELCAKLQASDQYCVVRHLSETTNQ